ncbi:DUF2147 domain-containing protein [Halosquirtibacter xylanolyticus]|uniref:DUF2147 domain-containing protein n=1 Tax=Halosquirtibacter xylanolyticus TaxID=3374599 RepID=UPI003749EE7E|nr:DUF2147 domain-containing protein [Prolixibacteraceae bacterium]
MKRRLLCIILLCLSTLSLVGQEKMLGAWNAGNQNTIVEVEVVGQVLTGIIISSDNSNVEVGKSILKEFKLKGAKWKGKIYSMKRKSWYNATLDLKDAKTLEITVFAGFISKKVVWKKD